MVPGRWSSLPRWEDRRNLPQLGCPTPPSQPTRASGVVCNGLLLVLTSSIVVVISAKVDVPTRVVMGTVEGDLVGWII